MSLKQIQKTNDMKKSTFYKFLLIGESKTGKTTAFSTIPGQKLAIGLTPRTRAALGGLPDIDLVEHFEDKMKREKEPRTGNIKYAIVPKAWDELWGTITDLWDLAHADAPFPYSAIMLDDLSTAKNFAMNYILRLRKKSGEEVATGLAGAPAEHHYVPAMTILQRAIQTLLLPLPCHFVMAAHFTMAENEETGISQYFPNVYGKSLRAELPGWFDEIYETVRTNKLNKQAYQWKTNGYGLKQFLGSTIGLPDPFPFILEESPSGLGKVLAKAGG